jgi:hypothetical protein
MKKIVISFILVITFITVEAQINLEHTFTSDYLGVSWFISNSNGIMYYSITDTITNQIKIYNQDYSIYKSVTINRPTGYSMGITNPSEQLFNTNNEIEFLIFLMKYTTQNIYETKMILYDENASVIKDFGTYNYFAQPYVVSNGNTSKLLIKGISANANSQFVDQIYSLPGSPANIISNFKFSNVQPAFPNPSNSIVNLPYKLENGQETTMNIYNSNGQLIEQKIIDSTFDRIVLNVQSYKQGIYIYSYNGISNRFIVD